MNPFKRLCLIIFGLAGIFCLIALAMPWYGPYQAGGTALMGQQYYYMAVEVTLAITALGVLVGFLRGIFTPRNRRSVIVSKSDGDQITVTRDAIASQATHVIEEDGVFTAKRVDVRVKKRGHVRVKARVQPKYVVDVVAAGDRLHGQLVRGLQTICGDNIDSVTLEFVDAETHEDQGQADDGDLDMSSFQQSYAEYRSASDEGDAGEAGIAEPAASDGSLEAAEPDGDDGLVEDGEGAYASAASEDEGASADEPDSDSTMTDITVPMGRSARTTAGDKTEGEE